MNAPIDMLECERRNAAGYPDLGAPFVRGSDRSNVNAQIDNSQGKNDALPWSWCAALFGGLGFGGVIVLCMLKPWESDARATKAEIRADFSQQLAEVRAEAKQAGTDAAIWKNRVVKLEAQLDAHRR